MVWHRDEQCAYRGCKNEAVNNSKFCVYHRNMIYKINKKRRKRESTGQISPHLEDKKRYATRAGKTEPVQMTLPFGKGL